MLHHFHSHYFTRSRSVVCAHPISLTLGQSFSLLRSHSLGFDLFLSDQFTRFSASSFLRVRSPAHCSSFSFPFMRSLTVPRVHSLIFARSRMIVFTSSSSPARVHSFSLDHNHSLSRDRFQSCTVLSSLFVYRVHSRCVARSPTIVFTRLPFPHSAATGGTIIPTSPTISSAWSRVSSRGAIGAGCPPCMWPRTLS